MHLTSQQIVFLVCSAITLGAALMVVTQREVLRAALFLSLSLVGVAGLYMLLEAFLLAAIQLFVYASGVSAMILFTAILTQTSIPPDSLASNHQWWAAALVAMALLGILGAIIFGYHWGLEPGPLPEHSIRTLGIALIAPQRFILPSATALILLLMTTVGVVAIAKEE